MFWSTIYISQVLFVQLFVGYKSNSGYRLYTCIPFQYTVCKSMVRASHWSSDAVRVFTRMFNLQCILNIMLIFFSLGEGYSSLDIRDFKIYDAAARRRKTKELFVQDKVNG